MTAPGFGTGSVNSGFVFLTLKDANQRDRSQQQIVDDLTKSLRNFSGIRVAISQPPTIGDRRSGFPVQFVLQAAELSKLKKILPQFMEKASESPKFTYVDLDL
jgi:multidrug efflux pump